MEPQAAGRSGPVSVLKSQLVLCSSQSHRSHVALIPPRYSFLWLCLRNKARALVEFPFVLDGPSRCP